MKKLCFIIFFLALLLPAQLPGQGISTIYWMDGIPQSTHFNPALIPEVRFYAGIPGISSIYGGFFHNGFSLDEVLQKDASGRLFWNEDNLLNSIRQRNLLQAGMKQEWLTMGWRSGSFFFSLSATEHLTGTVIYPKDLFTLALRGNDPFMQQNNTAVLSGARLNAKHYRELSLGMAWQWEQVFVAGFRIKSLNGLSSLMFDAPRLTLYTQPGTYDLLVQAEMYMSTSLPLAGDSLWKKNLGPYLRNTSNMGIGLDMGFTWKPLPRLSLAASLLDLGYIDWKKDVVNHRMNGSFAFEGIEFNVFGTVDNKNAFPNLVDTIYSIFRIHETTVGFRSQLNSRMLLASGYRISPEHQIGGLIIGRVSGGIPAPSYTFSYQYKPAPFCAVALSYSVQPGYYRNIGAAMHMNIRPLQLYIATDNIPGMLQPHSTQAGNLQLGMNLVFGYKNH